MSLAPYDMCEYCGGSFARRRFGKQLCDECIDDFQLEDEEPDYLDEPPWVEDLRQVLGDTLAAPERTKVVSQASGHDREEQ